MVGQKKPKTWAEEIADLDDPAPKDLDPEGSHDGDSNVDDSGDDTIAAKEHYIDVG
ncbi:MAG: hypothetical protein Q9197_006681, partial [Variospora fuerteventurae]